MVANALDSNPDTGNQGTPNPATSGNQGVQPNSTTAPAQPLDQVKTLVNEAVREALQDPDILKGMKDRRFNQIQKTLDAASPVLEQVRKILTPEQQAQVAQFEKDAVLEQLQQAVFGNIPTQTGTTQGGTPGSAALGLQTIDELLDLPANDVRVTELKLKYASDPAAYGREAKKLKGQLSQNPPPTPGEMPLPSGSTPRQTTAEELQANYLNELAGARGKGNQVGNKIKEKYRKLGLNVDDIAIRV